MSAVPVHLPQVYTEIDSYDGAWSDHGENRWGPELRAKGGTEYSTIYPQRTTVQGNSNAIIGIIEAKNTGDTPADGYHGLGLQVTAYKRIGSEVREVWDNDLLRQGNTEHWLTGLKDRWSRGSVIVQIPDEFNPDFVDTCWIYKTTSNAGKVRIDGMGIYDHKARVYKKTVTDNLYTGFTDKILYNFLLKKDPAGLTFSYYNRLIESTPSKISSGQQVDISINGVFKQFYGITNDSSNAPKPIQMFIGVKMLSNDGPDDWEVLGNIYSTVDGGSVYTSQSIATNIPVNLTRSFIADKSYFQHELYFVMAANGADTSRYKRPFIADVQELNFVMTVNEQKETGND